MNPKKLSVILYVDHPEQLSHALQKLEQSSLFPEQVQLIVIDPHDSQQAHTLCGALSNALYLAAPGAEPSAAYNLGLNRAEGEYLHFTLASAWVSPAFFESALQTLSLHPEVQMVSAAPVYTPAEGDAVPYSAAPVSSLSEDIYDLMQTPAKLQLCLQGYVLRASALQGRQFQEQLHEEGEIRLLLDLQMDCPLYAYLPNFIYSYTVPKEDEPTSNPVQHEAWWYQDSLRNFIIPMLEQANARFTRAPLFVQYAAYYLIFSKYQCNINGQDKGIVHGTEAAEDMIYASFHAVSLLDNQTLQARKIAGNCTVDRGMRSFFVYGKGMYLHRELHLYDDGSRFVTVMEHEGDTVDSAYWNRVAVLGSNKRERIRVRVMNYHNGILTVDANIGFIDLAPREQFELYAISEVGGKETVIYPEEDSVYALIKCFGHSIQNKHPVRYHFPVSANARQTISFFLRYQGKQYPLSLIFDTPYSRLETSNPYSYWMFRKNWMVSHTKYTLILRKAGKLFHFKRELLFLFSAYHRAEDKATARRYLGLRLRYWLNYPKFSKRHIWITFDKLYKAGDNGEYFFQYCMKQQDGIDCYYLINEDAPDTVRLRKQHPRNLIYANSSKSLMMALFAEAVMATHAGIVPYLGFPKQSYAYLKDLIHSENVCIQHGLSIQKIANFQNRRYANTKLYCLASPFEERNVSHPIYGYSPDMLKMTGLARYDGLVNRDQKLILITPTWRKGLIPVKGVGQTNDYWDGFKSTAYFRIYNSLINDPKLIACARKNGYRITYLLHPAMSGQLQDFEGNDYVDIIPATGDMSYEKILCESSLMVTDYSGVQFDFAYMRKPILYYHPADLPPHYEEGGLVYATQGFGPICTEHQELVEQLCQAMERGCTTQDEYIRRADSFFTYDDHNNCQRIYQQVRALLDETKKDSAKQAAR